MGAVCIVSQLTECFGSTVNLDAKRVVRPAESDRANCLGCSKAARVCSNLCYTHPGSCQRNSLQIYENEQKAPHLFTHPSVSGYVAKKKCYFVCQTTPCCCEGYPYPTHRG